MFCNTHFTYATIKKTVRNRTYTEVLLVHWLLEQLARATPIPIHALDHGVVQALEEVHLGRCLLSTATIELDLRDHY